jgi:hypothetical protein
MEQNIIPPVTQPVQSSEEIDLMDLIRKLWVIRPVVP